MSNYHAFEKFSDGTPSVILEAGFMLLDREILTENPELIAHGIAEGIRCYAYNEPINQVPEE
jgi:N-acetylmuramoyl-L-alanine amidase